MTSRQLATYYSRRACEYDRLYRIPEYRSDLVRLERWLLQHTRGRTILEVAAGTGYWTEIAARVAPLVVATDRNANTLAIAAERCRGKPVRFMAAGAFELPRFPQKFDVVMGHLWWSHVERRRRKEFLLHVSSNLRSGGALLMIDQNFLPGLSSRESRRDQNGNRYEFRTAGGSNRFEIIKNYPTAADLQRSWEVVCCEIRMIRTRYFWAACGTVCRETS